MNDRYLRIALLGGTVIVALFVDVVLYALFPDMPAGAVGVAAIGGVSVYLIVMGLGYDFEKPDLGQDTGGTSLRRGPHGDPWNKPSDRG